MTWVVETGMPSRLATVIVVAAAVSAANPSMGRSSTTRNPIVRTIRQPPINVPNPMAAAAATITRILKHDEVFALPASEVHEIVPRIVAPTASELAEREEIRERRKAERKKKQAEQAARRAQAARRS